MPYTFLNFGKGAVYLAVSPIINQPEEAYGCCLNLSHLFKFISVLQDSLIFLEKITEACYASQELSLLCDFFTSVPEVVK